MGVDLELDQAEFIDLLSTYKQNTIKSSVFANLKLEKIKQIAAHFSFY